MKNVKASTNLKKGKFNREELRLYGLEEKQIDLIMEYQEKFPILQQDNGNWLNGRILHEQLGVSKAFTTWVDSNLDNIDAIEMEDYVCKWIDNKGASFKGNLGTTKITDLTGMGYKKQYLLSLSIAKEIAMVAGVNNKANKKLKENSKIARKYFIYIEKAFEGRVEWNKDREDTLIKCKTLKGALIKYKNKVINTIPNFAHNNQFIAEFCLLNEVIIGMSANEYRRRKGYAKEYPIRNSFTEKELECVHILEQYDADLIEVQNEFNYEKRREYLTKKLQLIL